MKRKFSTISLAIATLVGSLSFALVPVSATSTSNNSTAQTASLKLVVQRGDNEIKRRLNSLNAVLKRLNATKKLSDTDKANLTSEVNAEISNLTTLKTKLDAETTVAAARADDQSIIDDYRVYALVVPKINLVITADAQLTAESKLTDLATKLQARLDSAKTAGKDVTDLQAKLNDLNSKVQAAQTISSTIESNVINLQPTDFNNDHQLLGGDRDQLKTAQSDIKAAVSDAKSIVVGLKKL